MPTHVFVDGSKARGPLVAAAVCLAGDVAAHRRAMAGLVLSGNRVHFTSTDYKACNGQVPAGRECVDQTSEAGSDEHEHAPDDEEPTKLRT